MSREKTSKNRTAIGFAIALLMSMQAQAQSKKPVPPPPPAAQSGPTQITTVKPVTGNDKVDITDLENKYWAPKDTDFSVVQNRTFSKDHKWSIAPSWGRPINDAHSEGNIYGVTANYFWSERMGAQFTYLKADLENNDATNDLAVYGSGVQPDHGKFTSYIGIGYNIVPFYAKMSFWGKKIIYFDLAFTPTIGLTGYDQVMEGGNNGKSALTYGLDISQFYFFSRWLALRVDLKNQWHVEEIVKYRGTTAPNIKGAKVTDKNIHDTMFLVGAMFYF